MWIALVFGSSVIPENDFVLKKGKKLTCSENEKVFSLAHVFIDNVPLPQETKKTEAKDDRLFSSQVVTNGVSACLSRPDNKRVGSTSSSTAAGRHHPTGSSPPVTIFQPPFITYTPLFFKSLTT